MNYNCSLRDSQQGWVNIKILKRGVLAEREMLVGRVKKTEKQDEKKQDVLWRWGLAAVDLHLVSAFRARVFGSPETDEDGLTMFAV